MAFHDRISALTSEDALRYGAVGALLPLGSLLSEAVVFARPEVAGDLSIPVALVFVGGAIAGYLHAEDAQLAGKRVAQLALVPILVSTAIFLVPYFADWQSSSLVIAVPVVILALGVLFGFVVVVGILGGYVGGRFA